MCNFSGNKIYPGRGTTIFKTDGKIYIYLTSKCKKNHSRGFKNIKISWTSIYRKINKK
jgi:large subunit ribosomal protein L24e